MKKSAFGIALSVICIAILVIIPPTDGATLTKGYTFTTNEVVTATKLHSLVDSATITGISASDLSDGIISNPKLDSNAVTTDKILDGTITGSDIATRTLTTTLYASNSVDGTALSTNILFTGKTLTFDTNQIASVGVSGTTTNTGTAGTVVKTSATGKISSTLIPFGNVTNQTWKLPAAVTLQSNTLSNLTSFTTTQTNSTVLVNAQVYFALSAADGGEAFVRVTDGTLIWDCPSVVAGLASGTEKRCVSISFWDVLTTSAKTYTLKAASNGANVINVTDTVAAQVTTNSTIFSVSEFY